MLFRGQYDFLSNMYPCKVSYKGRVFENAEAAFQSEKCVNNTDKDLFRSLNGKEAKSLGRRITMRNDWNTYRLTVMKDVVRSKFNNPELKTKLLATDNLHLQEDNHWNDTFWGVCNGVGQNNLGKILMEIRAELNTPAPTREQTWQKSRQNCCTDKESRAKQAAEHHVKMLAEKTQETNDAIRDSIIYGPEFNKPVTPKTANFGFANMDSVSAAYLFNDTKPCILNFASYKKPGGMFLEGSGAQEENLCIESNLFEILNGLQSRYYTPNNNNLNRGLYTNRAIFTPEVHFTHNGVNKICSVLTCAAPNAVVAYKYNRISEQENEDTLRDRIRFIYQILADNNVNTFIAGAWGCGVFGQDPKTVRNAFITTPTSCDKIIFAVPGDNDNARTFNTTT